MIWPIGYRIHIMVTLLFALAAYGSPFQGEPNLSFKNTPLIAPRCMPGQTQTWDITSKTEGRTHGLGGSGYSLARKTNGQLTSPLTEGSNFQFLIFLTMQSASSSSSLELDSTQTASTLP